MMFVLFVGIFNACFPSIEMMRFRVTEFLELYLKITVDFTKCM